MLELKKTVETGQVRQSFSHGRSKVVTVEVKKKRTFAADAGGALHEVKDLPRIAEAPAVPVAAPAAPEAELPHVAHDLTNAEKAHRARVLQDALKADEEARRRAAEREVERLAAEEEAQRLAAELAAAKAAQPEPEPEPEPAPVAGRPCHGRPGRRPGGVRGRRGR
jgi:translation initiation factor IF-2